MESNEVDFSKYMAPPESDDIELREVAGVLSKDEDSERDIYSEF